MGKKIKIRKKMLSMGFSGSFIQQGYAESIEKGYLIWDLEHNSFQRKYILNDYGFAKINISRGEIWEDRLRNIKFSNDTTKTNVYVQWEDYEENYSLEKEEQIIKFLKDKYGCKKISVNFEEIYKDNKLTSSEKDAKSLIEKDFFELLEEYIKENEDNFDCDEELLREVLALARQIDSELEIEPSQREYDGISWYIQSMVICNIFSYGDTPQKFDFIKLRGLTGIFGGNYTGKTNFIKALVWGLFQNILEGGDAKKLVNFFTEKDKAYVNIYLNIGGINYRILRSVRNYPMKNGEIKTTYDVKYQLYKDDEWIDEINDKKTNDKRAVKELIINSIGTASDFSKINLQSENGKDNYLNADQQSKNSVIKKYLGLQDHSDRHDYGKKYFNEITKDQKRLGDINEIQNELKIIRDKLKIDESNLFKLENEKEEKIEIIDEINDKIVSLSSTLEKTEPLQESDSQIARVVLEERREKFAGEKARYIDFEKWLSNNFKRELSENIQESLEELDNQLIIKSLYFAKQKTVYEKIDLWLKENPVKEEYETGKWEKILEELKNDKINLENQVVLFKGEKCPTCGHTTKKSDPEKEKDCLLQIDKLEKNIKKYQINIKGAKENKLHNLDVERKKMEIERLKSSLVILKTEKEEVGRKIDFINGSKGIIDHNKLVDQKSEQFDKSRKTLEGHKQFIDQQKELLEKIKENKEKEQKNVSIRKLIGQEKEILTEEKTARQNIDRQIVDVNGEA